VREERERGERGKERERERETERENEREKARKRERQSERKRARASERETETRKKRGRAREIEKKRREGKAEGGRERECEKNVYRKYLTTAHCNKIEHIGTGNCFSPEKKINEMALFLCHKKRNIAHVPKFILL